MSNTPSDDYLTKLGTEGKGLEKTAVPFLAPLLGWGSMAAGAGAAGWGLSAAHNGAVNWLADFLRDFLKPMQGAAQPYINPKSGMAGDDSLFTNIGDIFKGSKGKADTGSAASGPAPAGKTPVEASN